MHTHEGESEPSKYGLHPDVQEFLDSELGQGIALFSHTSGVFVFLLGLGYVAFRVWRQETPRDFGLKDLEVTRALVWGGLALNLVGGLMRLAQSGHPTLSSIGTNAWVRLILLKHLAWAALLVVSFRLVNRTLPRYLDTVHATPTKRHPGARRSVYGSVLVVLLVAGIGAAASTIGPGTEILADEAGHGAEPHMMNQTRNGTFSGAIASSPTQPGYAEGPIEVPANATRLTVKIQWTNANVDLTLRLTDPLGRNPPAGSKSGTTRTADVDKPMAGTWRYRVETTQLFVNEPFTGNFTIRYSERMDEPM